MTDDRESRIAGIITAAEPVSEETPLEEVVGRLAALPPLQYDRARESEAKRLGVRVGTLDAEVAKARSAADDSHAFMEDPEPWPEPVEGAVLVGDLVATIERYLILPAGAAETIALWTLHAHLHSTASISPILAITSPSPECGKTTLLDLLGTLVPRPLPVSNITTAALFRAVEKWAPTLLVDEADTFIRNSDELRGVLNSGHRRSAAYVIRTVGDDHEPHQFRTWAPKAIALIGKLPETLASRAIGVELRRKTATEKVERFRGDQTDHLTPLRQRCARFAADSAVNLFRANPDLPATLSGRTADNWRHLIAIADVASGEWPRRARQVAEAEAANRAEQTIGIQLLEDIRNVFAEWPTERISTAQLTRALGAMEERPWCEWKSGQPISGRQLARLLDPFKIGPTKFRAAGYKPGTRGYTRPSFEDAFARYLPDIPSRSATAPQGKESAISERLDPPPLKSAVADETGPEEAETLGCGVVADELGGRPEDGPILGSDNCGDADWRAAFDERAGILEHEGGLLREEAERLAAEDILRLREHRNEP